MRVRRLARAGALLLAPVLLATPAPAETREDLSIWLNATVIGTIPGSRIAYFVEVQPRISARERGVEQVLLRPAIGYTLSDAVTLYGSYTRVISPRGDLPTRREGRTFAQLSWTLAKRGSTNLSSRTRLEHRTVNDAREAGWRLREMIRYARPVSAADKVRALVSAEAFVALDDTDWGVRRGFDQLRTFAGFELPIRGRTTVEAGYLNQIVNATGGDMRVNHVASLAVFIRP